MLDQSRDRSPRVSVVVPTYDRTEMLARCLDALLNQTFDADSYEVIVADDGQSDATRRLVEQRAEIASESGHKVRYIPVTDSHGPAAARNVGWRVARGAVIAFTDDDCVPEPDWLDAGVRAIEQGDDGASGRIVVPLLATPTDYERDVAGLEVAEFATANCFYRRAAIESVGGFDERFRVAWREDTDLRFKMMDQGLRLTIAPEAVVIHPVRPARWGISLGQQRKSMFNALLYKKHPTLYRRHIQGLPPWRYYLTVSALITALAAALTGRRRMAIGAVGLWSLMTARFCTRRLHGTSHASRHVAEMIVTSILIPPLAIYWRLRGAVRFHVFFL